MPPKKCSVQRLISTHIHFLAQLQRKVKHINRPSSPLAKFSSSKKKVQFPFRFTPAPFPLRPFPMQMLDFDKLFIDILARTQPISNQKNYLGARTCQVARILIASRSCRKLFRLNNKNVNTGRPLKFSTHPNTCNLPVGRYFPGTGILLH